jgi:hypothetical protein
VIEFLSRACPRLFHLGAPTMTHAHNVSRLNRLKRHLDWESIGGGGVREQIVYRLNELGMSETNGARTQTHTQPQTRQTHTRTTRTRNRARQIKDTSTKSSTLRIIDEKQRTLFSKTNVKQPRRKSNSPPTHSSLGPMPRFIVPLRDGYLLALYSRGRKPGRRSTTTITIPK